MTNPNEQWWWKDATRLLNATWASSPKSVEILQGIVAEAERRGRVAAWEEALALEIPLESFCSDPKYREACKDFMRAIKIKLSSLDNSSKGSEKKCCHGEGAFGNCGRGTKKGCKDIHCRCMNLDGKCRNMHYVDCFEHYVHVEHVDNSSKE